MPPSIGVLCVPLMGMLIYVPRFVVLRAQTKQPEGLDNNDPRGQQARLTGYAKRAQGAHMNGFEAFPLFAAAVILCELSRASHPSATLDRWETILSLVFVGLRTVYIGLYLGDKASPRSLVWMLALAATLGLYLLPWVT